MTTALTLLAGLMFAQIPGVEQELDVVYAQPGGEELKLDIARPAGGSGPFPAVLVIHGGGWKGGNKQDVRPILAEFAARGYVAASPQYRFSPKHAHPAQVHDVKAAVRWLRANAAKYKIDAERFGAIGFSAGGHLALMLGVTEPKDGLEGDAPKDAPSSKVQAVVNFFGPTDLAADDIPAFVLPLVDDLVGGKRAEKADAVKSASPLTFVTPDDAPILTFQGTKDPLVPHTQAVKLADKQTQAGVPGRVELLVGLGHGNDWGPDLERAKAATFAFLDAHLKAKARP